MDRITCENCGREYESILPSCPECGHANEELGAGLTPTLDEMREKILSIPLHWEEGELEASLAAAAAAAELEPQPEPEEPEEEPAEEAPAEAEEPVQEPAPTEAEEPAEPEPEPEPKAAPAPARRRAQEDKYKVPTWALGAACAVLGLAIVIGVIFILSSLGGLSGAKKTGGDTTQMTLADTIPNPETQDPEEAVANTPMSLEQNAPAQSEAPAEPEEPEEPAEPEEPEELTCQSISLDVTDVTLQYSGESFTITPTVFPVELADQVTWTCSDETLINVEDGKVLALGGKKDTNVIITAACQDKSAICVVRFKYDDDPTILTINYSDVTLRNGDVLDITIESTLTQEQAAQVVWVTDNANAAVVENGHVTAVGSGTANITASLGTRLATCIVRVK